MKVAINRCYGGFGLSNQAFEKLLERKGIAFEKEEDPTRGKILGVSYYIEGKCGTDDGYLSEYDFHADRSDIDLIAVIEEMGESADGAFAKIGIVDIPDDVEFTIEEYDGMEWVAEKHRTWS